MAYGFATLFHQIIGKRNVFGYCKVIINKSHLMYWFLGEFYASKIFKQRVVIVWITFNIFSILTLFLHSLLYIILTSNRPLSRTLFAIEVIITTIYLLILIPLGSYMYRDHISETFKLLDENRSLKLQSISSKIYHRTSSCSSQRCFENANIAYRNKYSLKMAYLALSFQVALFSIYIASTFLDLVVGYSVDKLRDPKYYFFPLYCENVDNFIMFLMLSSTQLICGIPIAAMYFSNPFFPVIIAREFYCKFQSLSDFMDHRSILFKLGYEQFMNSRRTNNRVNDSQAVSTLQRCFLHDVHWAAKFHQDLLRGIDHFRSYIEYNMTISLFIVLCIDIILIYTVTLMESESVLMKIKISAHATATSTIFFVHCLIGKLYDDMGQMFANSVYDSPWYYMNTSNRRSLQLLLYQAKGSIEFKGMRIYLLNMEFLLRWCNYLYSIVNVLRRRTLGKKI